MQYAGKQYMDQLIRKGTMDVFWVPGSLCFSETEMVGHCMRRVSAVGIHGDGAAVFQAGAVRGGRPDQQYPGDADGGRTV